MRIRRYRSFLSVLTCFLIVLVLPSTSLLAQQTMRGQNTSEMYVKGLQLIGENKHDEAIVQFKLIIDTDPDFPGAYSKLVTVYQVKNELDRASQYFQELLRKYPERSKVYYGIGLVDKGRKKYENAIENFKKSVQLSRDCAHVVKDLVDCHYALKDLDGAVTYLNDILGLDAQNAAAHYGLGRAFELQSKWDKALTSINNALQLKPDFLPALFSKANIHEDIGALQECLLTSEKGLSLAEKEGNKEYQTLFLNLMGIAQRKTGHPHKALDHYQRALKIDKEIGYKRGERIRTANIGNVYYSLSEYTKALEYYKSALQSAGALEDKRNQINYLNSIGAAYRNLDDLQEALKHYKQALSLSKETRDKRREGMVSGNMGIVYKRLGDLDRALVCYQKALINAKETGNKRGESITLGNIGNIYKSLGDFSEALEYYNSALQIDRQIGTRGSESIQLSSIGMVYYLQGRYTDALEYFRSSITIAEEIDSKMRQANGLTYLGDIYNKMGRFAEARTNCERALDIFKAIGSQSGEAFALFGLGTVQLNQHNYDESVQFFLKALSIGEKIKSPVITWDAYANLASVWEKQGDLQKSLHYYQLAVKEIEHIRGGLSTEDVKAGLMERKIDVYEKAVNIYAELHQKYPGKGYDRESFQLVEQAKARVFLDLLTESHADISKGVDSQFREKERVTVKEISRIQKRLRSSRPAEQEWEQLAAELKEAEQQYEGLQREIRRSSAAYADLVYPEPYGLQQVRSRIVDKNSALLEYFLEEERSYVWVITRERSKLHILPKRSEIEDEVEAYLKTLSKPAGLTNPITRHQALGYALYQKLLGSAAHSFENKSRLIIVPDGALYFLPFETLISQKADENEASNYLIKDYEFSTGPSSSVLCYLQEKRGRNGKRNERLLAFGDPYFGGDRDAGSVRGEAETDSSVTDHLSNETEMSVRGLYKQRGFQFKRLPFSGNEVMSIGKLFPAGNKTLHIGENAREEVVKQAPLHDYQYIHFATHGIIEQMVPSRSGIVLTLDESSDEDGFLQVNEIFNLDLDADLVVLSACRTGLGRLRRGEGIVGLTRAFIYAGTPSVLVSLWNINDRSTADFMKNFYEQLMKGKSKSKALQLAKLEMLEAARKSYQHPFYWAPFILVGDYK